MVKVISQSWLTEGLCLSGKLENKEWKHIYTVHTPLVTYVR